MMNRNRLIEVFISNVANAIIHQILEKAIDKQEIADVYNKEVRNSKEIQGKNKSHKQKLTWKRYR